MAKSRHLSIKNFDKFQHYKHRNPPWIKLHLELLDDADFLRLPDATKWQYVGLLLLASRHENQIFNDEIYIKNRLGLTGKLDLSARFMKGHVLARCKQDASILHTNADSEKSQSREETEKSRDRGEAETEERQSRGEDTPAAVVPTSRRPRSPVKPMTGDVWESYRSSYLLRYGADPIRNASVNAILTRVIERLGTETAPAVASFYVQHNKPFYVEKRHPVNLLLADAEGLHTQWITGVKATTGEAKNAERRDDAIEQIKRVKAAMGDA